MKLCIQCGVSVGDDWHCEKCHYAPDLDSGCRVLSPEFQKENHGYDSAAYSVLKSREGGSFWFRARNALITRSLGRYFPTAGRFLEIGCGTGFVLAAIERARPDLQVSGSEVLAEGLAVAVSRCNHAQFYQLDARALPFKDEFSVIGAFDVLEHIPEDQQVLSAMYQAVKPDGGIVVTVPQHDFLWSAADDYALHQRRYTRSELVKKVEDVGFSVVFVSSFVSFLLPLMMYSRWRSRWSRQTYDPAKELSMHPAVDKAFGGVMAIERFLILCGVRFPMGGSLLLVGIKNNKGEKRHEPC